MFVNKIEAYLNKKCEEFTREDLVKFIIDNDIHLLNFRYVGGDGRLKALSFVITSAEQVNQLLSSGERVDGSSLFSYIEASSSDLYVVPQYKTAFVNPFEEVPTLDILCQYFDNNGNPLASAPFYMMQKAHQILQKKTGMTLEAMGEIEFYVKAKKNDEYPASDQKGYHESAPFIKHDFILKEAIRYIAECGGKIKYAHSEVGNFKNGDYDYEQYEIELIPTYLEDAANTIILTKWILRMLGYKYGVTISFAPKITVGKAGSGMHIHLRLMKNGKNMLINKKGLSTTARKMIAGILSLSPALTAFGNTIPTSYLRLVPHQEAPTTICWGDRNRSVLIRVPLGWLGKANQMITKVNPLDKPGVENLSEKQTIEFRCPDGSANVYLLFAGIAVATLHGLEMKNALEVAEDLYVNVNIHKEENKDKCKQLNHLPASCVESADALMKLSSPLTRYGVFTEGILSAISNQLRQFDDKGLSEKLYGKNDEIAELVEKYLHIG
ncbi:MAG: glutamine synthetase [Sphingobacteriales bacterium]|nr:glutamine synthetase [Sphingobacteriales bacterium]